MLLQYKQNHYYKQVHELNTTLVYYYLHEKRQFVTDLHEEADTHDLKRQRHVYNNINAVIVLPQNPAREDTNHRRMQHGSDD